MKRRKNTHQVIDYYRSHFRNTADIAFVAQCKEGASICRLKLSHQLATDIVSDKYAGQPNTLLHALSSEVKNHEMLNMLFELESRRIKNNLSKNEKKRKSNSSRKNKLEKMLQTENPKRFQLIEEAFQREADIRELPSSLLLQRDHCHICKKFFSISTQKQTKQLLAMKEEDFINTMYECAASLAAYATQTKRVKYFDWKNFAYAGFSKADFEKIIDSRTTHLKELGLTGEVDWLTIKAKFKKLAKIHHPDKGGDPEKMRRINAAYKFLHKQF